MAQLSESDGGPWHQEVPSLWQRFAQSAEENPDALAVACIHQEPNLYGITSTPLGDEQYHQHPYLRWSFREFKGAIDRLVEGLRRRGAKDGSIFITFMPNMVEPSLVLWAAYFLGAVHVPLNPRNLLNKEEVTHMIKTAIKAGSAESIFLFAATPDVAAQLDGLDLDITSQNFCVGSNDSRRGWNSFSELMVTDNVKPLPSSHGSKDKTVFFTSGTTSLPKGCLWEFPKFSRAIEQRRSFANLEAKDVATIVVPNNHAIGCFWQMMSHCAGAAVVYPGTGFMPQAMMDVMQREKCTHVSLVPTMVHALLGVKARGGGKIESLKGISLGGTVVSPSVLLQCEQQLGAKTVEVAFGMSEGVLISSGSAGNWRDIVRGEDVSVGRAYPGTALRICAPNEFNPVPRGVPGELHFSGVTLMSGYIGKQSDDFYTGDDGNLWFRSGDQAIMSEDGLVFVTGRYKEMIIRGAENISPAAIESVLGLVPEMAKLNVQIVGAPDEIAGEVPVAIIENGVTAEQAQALRNTVLDKMGPAYVPDEVISLQNLGLKELPRTMAGKVQKNKLMAAVKEYRKAQEASLNGSTGTDLHSSVRRIWQRALGHDVDEAAAISDFADSITVMKVRDSIVKETGRSITLAEMAEVNTIGGQIELLEKQTTTGGANRQPTVIRRSGPPKAGDIAHLLADPESFDKTRTFVDKKLKPYKLGWENVEDVLPAYDFGQVFAQTKIFDTWNLKMGVMTRGKSSHQARTALEAALKNNRLMCSFMLWDQEALGLDLAIHVVIRHDQHFLDQCIKYGGKVKSMEDVNRLVNENTDRTTVPGPLVRSLIVDVEDLGHAAIIMDVHHAITDASASQIFFDDLDNALKGAPMDVHIDYKSWADSYHALRTSLDAQIAVNWHVRRLKDLASHKKALWPHGPPKHWTDGVMHQFEAPGIPKLRHQHRDITAPIILKSAWALLNVYRNGYTHALFGNLEAARTRYPFVPKSLELIDGQGYEATNVSGITIQCVMNFVELKKEETVLEFMARMQDDQNNLTKYASAPLKQLLESLGDGSEVYLQTLQTNFFNWVPGFGAINSNPYEVLERVGFVARPEVLFGTNAGLGGENSSTVLLHLRGSAFEEAGFRQLAKELEQLTLWISDEKNWNKSASKFREGLDLTNGVH